MDHIALQDTFNNLEAVLLRDGISFLRQHTTDCDHYLNWEHGLSASIRQFSTQDREKEMYFAWTVEWLDEQQQKTKTIKLV